MGGLLRSDSPMAEPGIARDTLDCRLAGWEGTEQQLIALESSDNVYELKKQ